LKRLELLQDRSKTIINISPQAVDLGKTSDVIVLAVGANWNSDGENGDRGTLGLSLNQSRNFISAYDK
jgi:hypothetical protein